MSATEKVGANGDDPERTATEGDADGLKRTEMRRGDRSLEQMNAAIVAEVEARPCGQRCQRHCEHDEVAPALAATQRDVQREHRKQHK